MPFGGLDSGYIVTPWTLTPQPPASPSPQDWTVPHTLDITLVPSSLVPSPLPHTAPVAIVDWDPC